MKVYDMKKVDITFNYINAIFDIYCIVYLIHDVGEVENSFLIFIIIFIEV